MMQCVAEGHEIVSLANLKPPDEDEMDSYMYQTVGHHAVDLYAEAMGLPLYRRTIRGSAVHQGKDYCFTDTDEVEDLYQLLKQVQEEVGVEAVSVGAILSDYQRVRVENVCSRLGLVPLAFLWRRNQEELLQEMIQCNLHAIVIKVAALGLYPDKHLGMTIEQIYPHMKNMAKKYGLNVCGEGGEYETLTLDCPLFNKSIVIDKKKTVLHSDDAFAPVAYLHFEAMHLEDKSVDPRLCQLDRVNCLPMMNSANLMSELFTDPTVIDVAECGEDAQEGTCMNCVLNRLTDFDVYDRKNSSGQVWISGITGAVVRDGENVTKQTTSCMDKMIERLHKDCLDVCDVVTVHLYVKDMADFQTINHIYKRYFGVNPPVRICVQVSLPTNVSLILNCMAFKGEGVSKATMHVQGLSHWAPANIGPYSQAVKLGDTIYVAGQIGLCPASLQIIHGGILAESRLSLRHVSRVLAAMDADCTWNDVALVICYVTNKTYIPPARRELEMALSDADESRDVGVGSDEGFIEFLVVPALPKGASIEWHVYAKCCRLAWKDDVSCSRCNGFIVRRHCRFAEQCEDQPTPQITFRITIEREKLNIVNTDTEQPMIEAGLLSMRDMLVEHKFDQSQLGGLQFFYLSSRIHHGHLQKESWDAVVFRNLSMMGRYCDL